MDGTRKRKRERVRERKDTKILTWLLCGVMENVGRCNLYVKCECMYTYMYGSFGSGRDCM